MNSLKISNGLVNVSSRKKVAVDVRTRTKNECVCMPCMGEFMHAIYNENREKIFKLEKRGKNCAV